MEFCGLLIILIVLLVNILIVNYVRKLERVTCDCSENWKRNLMEVYVWFVIALVVISIISSFAFARNFKANIKL